MVLNRFLHWTFFGGEGVIAENSRDGQRKAIKYNHLVANCLIFHNLVVTALKRLFWGVSALLYLAFAA